MEEMKNVNRVIELLVGKDRPTSRPAAPEHDLMASVLTMLMHYTKQPEERIGSVFDLIPDEMRGTKCIANTLSSLIIAFPEKYEIIFSGMKEKVGVNYGNEMV